ncbi:NCS1 family nucleobase:cation symporter-1 [Micrococcales bacterium 31B]|nr:NCS1 family nucleobase:cation symporter-1 [Micrococcales bacterium 31B]
MAHLQGDHVTSQPTHPAAAASGTTEASLPDGVCPTLYNRDLAPTQREGRPWSTYNIFALWANDVHSLGNYGFILGLFALGLGVWQVFLAFVVGTILLFLLLNLSGFMGHKTGVPFPVMSRIAFGIRGCRLPAALRGGVAIVWFGIQTYLATLVLRVMIIAVAPSAADLDTNSILGLSTLGWISFAVLWIAQVFIVRYGMNTIRVFEAFAGPVVLVTLVGLAIWMLARADFSIAWSTSNPLSGGEMWRAILGGGALWVSIYATFVLNFCDFTRGAKSRRAIVMGNFWGIPINTFLFAAVAMVMAGAQYKIDGQVIASPADIVHAIPNTFLLLIASFALLLLTVAVNVMANIVAPVYALTSFFPRHLDFAKASLVASVLGFVILPWNLYNSPVVINYFLGGLGALLGPLFGVVMADYWMIRKGGINVPHLYSNATSGAYFYRGGVNHKAIIAFAAASVLALITTFVPAFKPLADFSWFIGAGIAAVVFYAISERGGRHEFVDGERIAVSAAHH